VRFSTRSFQMMRSRLLFCQRAFKQRQAGAAGFTLMEVLTVVFIIAVASTSVILLVPPADRPIDKEATRLKHTINELSDRAILTGSLQGLRVRDDGYEGMQLQANGWVRLSGFQYDLPDGLQILPLLNVSVDTEDASAPHFVFQPIGIPVEGVVQLNNRSETVDVSVGIERDS